MNDESLLPNLRSRKRQVVFCAAVAGALLCSSAPAHAACSWTQNTTYTWPSGYGPIYEPSISLANPVITTGMGNSWGTTYNYQFTVMEKTTSLPYLGSLRPDWTEQSNMTAEPGLPNYSFSEFYVPGGTTNTSGNWQPWGLMHQVMLGNALIF